MRLDVARVAQGHAGHLRVVEGAPLLRRVVHLAVDAVPAVSRALEVVTDTVLGLDHLCQAADVPNRLALRLQKRLGIRVELEVVRSLAWMRLSGLAWHLW